MSSVTSRRITVGAGIAAATAAAVGLGWVLAGPGTDRPDRDPAAVSADRPSGAGGLGGPGDQTPTAPPPAGPADPGPAPSGDTGQPATGPQIGQFEAAQQPQCPGGTSRFPTEGQPVVLEWRVTGTDQVTLAVDGPGAYGTYPAEGGATLSFGCGGTGGDIQEHTYRLTATADGVTVTETLVVTAEVHDRSDV